MLSTATYLDGSNLKDAAIDGTNVKNFYNSEKAHPDTATEAANVGVTSVVLFLDTSVLNKLRSIIPNFNKAFIALAESAIVVAEMAPLLSWVELVSLSCSP